jgi:peptide chain release factor 1
MNSILQKLDEVERRYLEIESKLSDPGLADRPDEFRRLSREHAGLQELIAASRHHQRFRTRGGQPE